MNTVVALRSTAQKRAKFALERIQRVPDTQKEEYARLVRRLPVMILRNGLGQAIAFHLASAEGDADSAAGRVVRDLSDWLMGVQAIYEEQRDARPLDRLIDALMAGSGNDYRRAQVEALGLLDWMKKFADAFLPSQRASEPESAQ